MQDFDFEKFLIYLRQFQNKIQKEFNEEIKSLRISSTHIGTIILLKKSDLGYSMTELSKLMKVDNALMTRNIKELEKKEYIYRDRKNETERKYRICLTKKGELVADELQKIICRKQEEFQNTFNEEEQKIINSALCIVINKFINSLEEER